MKYDNASAISGHYPLVAYNYGKITNAIFRLVECAPNSNNYVTLCSYYNNGIIDNFIVDYKVPFYCSRVAGGIAIYGTGIYQNGYIIGENIKGIFNMSNSQYRCIGGLVYKLEVGGTIENVYSLVNIDCSTSADYTWYNRVGNIVDHIDRATVRNIYSLGLGENAIYTSGSTKYGPTIAINSSNAKVYNSYYFECDEIFNTSYNTKGNSIILKDEQFQDQFLNSQNCFDTSIVKNGYFPHLKLSDVMPNQEFIDLPTVANEDLPDLLSLDVIEEKVDENEVIVSFSIHNPDGTDILDIKIENLDVEILEQSYENGRSTVIAKLYNPRTYVSKYSLLSIKIDGAAGRTYTRKFEKDERSIFVDFYKRIYNVSDWKEINSNTTQNYRLMTDLDFKNEGSSIAITKKYTGKIDGNNHTIKNILLPESYNNCFITTLNGTLKNLFIENYVHKPTGNCSRMGLINKAESDSIIDNIHIKGIDLENSYKEGTVYIGGIVSELSNAIIMNSSVSNFKLKIEESLSTISAGGIAGYVTNARISNSYVQYIDFDIEDVVYSNGIGGIIGQDTSTGGFINYCYSHGKIVSDQMNIGGIYGITYSNVKYNYSFLNIETQDELIGGIGGQDKNTSTSSTSYNLWLGNIYNKKDNASFVNKIIGSNTSELYNYCFDEQLVNGKKSDNINGVILLSADEILKVDIYNDLSELGFGDHFDYSQLSYGILPKIKNSSTKEILPNQSDLKLIEDKLKIDSVEFSKGQNINVVEVSLVIDNPNEVEVTGVNVEYMNINIKRMATENGKTYINFEGTAERYYDNYKINRINYKLNGLDKYVESEGMINSILYKEITSFADWQNIDDFSAQNYRLTVDLDFTGRKNINTNLSIGRLEAEGESKTIKGLDIKFTGNTQSYIKEITKSIKNINFENITIKNEDKSNRYYLALLGKVSGDISNLKFDNIYINGPKVDTIGIIYRCSSMHINDIELKNIKVIGRTNVGGFCGIYDSSTVRNIKGENIIVEGAGNYTAGIFGHITSRVVHDIRGITVISSENATSKQKTKIKSTGSYVSVVMGTGTGSDIIVKDATVSGASYVACITGYSESNCGENNEVRNCEITGTGSYVGGLYGYTLQSSSSSTHTKHRIYDSKITGKASYTGGIFGRHGRGTTLKEIYVDNCIITGKDYVGGISGNVVWDSNSTTYSYVTSSTITGTGNYVGGISGYSGSTMQYNYVEDCEIIGNNNVGGIVGWGCSSYCLAKNTNITGKSSVGGIVGYIGSNVTVAYSVYEYDQNNPKVIKGITNVGGIAGTLRNGNVYYCHTNAEIISTGSGAGGIIGYLHNQNNIITTISGVGVLNNNVTLYNCGAFGVKITGPAQIGGLIGKSYQTLLNIGTNYKPKDYIYNNYIEAYINTTESTGSIASLGLGSDRSENYKLANTYIYKYSTINGQSVDTGKIDNVVSIDRMLEISDLQTRTTYTSKLKWTTDNNVINSSNNVIKNSYPTQAKLNQTRFIPIKLPQETASPTFNTYSLRLNSLFNNAKIYELPEVYVYPVDIDKVNIEFSAKDRNSYFYIKQNDINSENISIDEYQVFTYQYNFKDKFDIIISNDIDSKIIEVNPNGVYNKMSINDKKYYYIKDNMLYEKDELIGSNYLNLYENKALDENGNIYNLNNFSIEKTIDFENLSRIETIPFGEFEYCGYKINTYNKYSDVIIGEEIQTKNQKMIIKNNQLYSFDKNLEIKNNGIIIDQYNNKEYQTILGTDGKMYDLKTKLNYPKDFVNKDIDVITNNIFNSTENIIVYYKTGRIVIFNYISGDIIYDNEVKDEIPILDFIASKFNTEELMIEIDDKQYEQSLQLKEKIIETSVSDYMNKNTNIESSTEFSESNSSFSSNYISVYNPVTENYSIYDEQELLTNQEPKSENVKIEKSAQATRFYMESAQYEDSKKGNGKVLVFIIIGVVILGLYIINRYRTKFIDKNKR